MPAHPAPAAALVASVTGVLLLVGCSGPAATGRAPSAAATAKSVVTKAAAAPAAPVPSDPCTLISSAEASKAIGSTVASTVRQGTNCVYNNEDHGFELELYAHGGNDEFTAAQIGMKAQYDKAPAIAGVGDRAIGIGGEVVVQSGSAVIEIKDDFADKDPGLVRATALARVALSHL